MISVIKNFFIYSFGALILRMMTMIIAPLTLGMLAPHEYGLIALVYSFISVTTVFVECGLRQVFWIEYFHHEATAKKELLNHIVAIYFIIAGPVYIGLLSNLALINRFIFVDQASHSIIIAGIGIIFVNFFSELFFQLLRYQQKATLLTTIQLTAALSTLLLNLFFVYRCKWGVAGIFTAHLIGIAITAGCALIGYMHGNYHHHINLKASWQRIYSFVKIGLPFVPNILCNWILSSSNRWTLAHYTDLHHVGIYAVADMVSQLYQVLILYPLSGSYLPFLFERYAHNKHDLLAIEQDNQQMMWRAMAGMVVLITCGYYIGRPIAYWILPIKYHEAINYLWFIAMSHVFLMGTYFCNALVQFHKKTAFLGLSLAVPAFLNFGIAQLTVASLDIAGCVMASMIAYASYFALSLAYNFRVQRQLKTAKKHAYRASTRDKIPIDGKVPPRQKDQAPTTNNRQL